MKSIVNMFLSVVVVLCLFSCHETKIGYLRTVNAEYIPDSLVVRKTPDPIMDANRIRNNAPWVTTTIQGVLGTEPLNYELYHVTAYDGGDASIFSQELSVKGAGKMELPLDQTSPAGRYVVSIKVYNEDYEAILEDAFTFILK